MVDPRVGHVREGGVVFCKLCRSVKGWVSVANYIYRDCRVFCNSSACWEMHLRSGKHLQHAQAVSTM